MPRWWKTPSWRRSTNRFRCWIRWPAAKRSCERPVEEAAAPPPKDSFNEVDFGSYFQEYLDPGYRTQPEYEESEKPSFENFLSQPTTLSDHLAWQLGALTLEPALADAAEFVVGNLDEDGYLAASEEEMAAVFGQILDEQAEKQAHKDGSQNGALPGNAVLSDNGASENAAASEDGAISENGVAPQTTGHWN